MPLNRLLPASLGIVLLAAAPAALAQTTPPPAADTLRPASRPQLNTQPPAGRPGGPVYTAATQVTETPPPLTLGLSLGWGAPYAAGVEVAYRVRPAVDANVGVGLGSSGAKIGVGARVYVPGRSRNRLFVGSNLVYSSSEAAVDVDINGITGRYVVHSSALLHLRGGLHRQFRRNALQVAVGYGAVLGPHPVIELLPGYGPGSATARNIVEAVGPGGIEVSVSFLIGLGRGSIAVH